MSVNGTLAVISTLGAINWEDVWGAAVDTHNEFRSLHGVPPLTGSEQIHGVAQAYADFLAANNQFAHSGNSLYGENLAGVPSANEVEAVRTAIRLWYNEETLYDYNNPGFSGTTGHFTAVVWRSTTQVGIGVAWNPVRRWFVVVANYNPPGNYLGEFAANVPPPTAAPAA